MRWRASINVSLVISRSVRCDSQHNNTLCWGRGGGCKNGLSITTQVCDVLDWNQPISRVGGWPVQRKLLENVNHKKMTFRQCLLTRHANMWSTFELQSVTFFDLHPLTPKLTMFHGIFRNKSIPPLDGSSAGGTFNVIFFVPGKWGTGDCYWYFGQWNTKLERTAREPEVTL